MNRLNEQKWNNEEKIKRKIIFAINEGRLDMLSFAQVPFQLVPYALVLLQHNGPVMKKYSKEKQRTLSLSRIYSLMRDSVAEELSS